jgi:uncharacterized protein (TIGR01777 family)
MKIFLTGATGFIGTKLVKQFLSDNHEIVCYVRNIEKARKKLGNRVELLSTNVFQNHIIKTLEGCDAVVNLAGEPIVKRWTKKNKKKIYDSRIDITKKITNAIESCKTPPKVLISSSAVGFYGNRGDETLIESSHKSSGWLSRLCNQWEKSSYPSCPGNLTSIRIVNLRTGIVLGDGGALKKMLLPFKMGLGGTLGSGNQWMPWIHIEDMISIIIEAVNNENIYGPINCVAPAAVTNKHFTKILGKTLKRPTIFPVPSFVLKIIFGEGACVLLDSQKVRPRKLTRHGFSWKFGSLYTALEDLLRK